MLSAAVLVEGCGGRLQFVWHTVASSLFFQIYIPSTLGVIKIRNFMKGDSLFVTRGQNYYDTGSVVVIPSG